MKNKGFTLIEVLIVVAIIGILLSLVGVLFISIPIETGNGNQIGYISATEKSGLFFKSGRVYLKPTLESTQEDEYCVFIKDEKILEDLQIASDNKNRVKIYHRSWISAGLKCEGEGAFIYKFEIIK